jgi:hypothetical protein
MITAMAYLSILVEILKSTTEAQRHRGNAEKTNAEINFKRTSLALLCAISAPLCLCGRFV